jgi:hypothetical protein
VFAALATTPAPFDAVDGRQPRSAEAPWVDRLSIWAPAL